MLMYSNAGSQYGFNGMFAIANFGSGVATTDAKDNASVRTISGVYDTNWASSNHWYASAEAMGVEAGAKIGEWHLTPDSPLRTGAEGGARIGPDFDMMNALRDAIEAGVIA